MKKNKSKYRIVIVGIGGVGGYIGGFVGREIPPFRRCRSDLCSKRLA
jgi:hypothetical protein